MNQSFLAIAVAASLSSYASFSLAQEQEKPTQETMVVTANRVEQKLTNVLAPIEIIDRTQIDAIQAKSLSEVLRRLPGVQIANQGGVGQSAELYIRGRSTKNTLVLINGVRLGSATTGSANISAMPLDGVQRIEVIRGARAAVYGSDAVSGVVNIITTSQNNAPSRVKAGVGSFGSYNIGATLSLGDVHSGWLNLTATHQTSEGYNIQPTSTNPIDADDDGYESQYLVLDMGKRLNDAWLLKANGYYQKHYTEFDNPWTGVDKSDSDLYSLSVASEYSREGFDSELSLSTNQDKAKSYGQGQPEGTISTNRVAINWNNNLKVTEQLNVIGGVDWYKDNIDNTTKLMTKDSRDNGAVFAGALYQQGIVTFEGNVRHDDNSAYGNYTTYQLGGGVSVTEQLKVVAMHGTAFKAPTFNELYWPKECGSWGCYEGNPNLVPEESATSEIALEGDFSHLDFRLAAYQSNVDKMIASNGSTNVNINKAKIEGVEILTRFSTGVISHEVSYDYLDAKDETTGNFLARRARHSGKWNASYSLEAWQFDLSYLYQGKRYDDLTNTKELDPYSLVDIAGTYFFSNGVSIGAKVGNLLNEEYEMVKGYKTPERNYYVNAMYEF
ncbi:TonB-dependent receptor domain-containing protein [Vibrio methylphosphonaticus]|uniref:TonB-dependent receptor domain-containing protein n=1 Tax=Vibrio methylphosphonaticus TaxID=2946866 RepID=UPI00202AB31C|nr:TonB-dependent receptor [Vibrio methylphosphonaticus]MCL9776472.1 TonB-dependent receptor [Vibrio methylphosphonaticus]